MSYFEPTRLYLSASIFAITRGCFNSARMRAVLSNCKELKLCQIARGQNSKNSEKSHEITQNSNCKELKLKLTQVILEVWKTMLFAFYTSSRVHNKEVLFLRREMQILKAILNAILFLLGGWGGSL